MFRLYLEILSINVNLSTFAVLVVATIGRHALTSQDLIFPAAILALLTTLVFIVRDLMRVHDARIAARALAQRTGAQLAIFKTTLRKQASGRPEILERF